MTADPGAPVSGSARTVRIGTRGSALALAQVTLVAEELKRHQVAHEIVVIETAGDRRAPDTTWGEGAFVTAIESALVEGGVDVAVHSAKDVPTDEDPRLLIGAYLVREPPLDALVLPGGAAGSIDTLPAGTVIGTDSPRRTGFLRAYRPDLDVRRLHGNVDTRLRRLDEGVVDALLLAAAGLVRLGHSDRISQLVPVAIIPPAPGQGAIAVQVRADDDRLAEITRRIDDAPTRTAVETERAFLRATGGGCRAPIGALATISGNRLELIGGFATLDGRTTGVEEISGPIDRGASLAKTLALRIIERRARLPGAPRVIVTRPAEDAPRLASRLAEHGIAAIVVPAIEIQPLVDSAELSAAVASLAEFDWAIVTSANAARAAREAAGRCGIALSVVRWAAVGQHTSRELIAGGVPNVWLPRESNAMALAVELPLSPGQRVLWVRGDLASDDLADRLAERQATVRTAIAYRTLESPPASRALLTAALGKGPPDAVIFASPSAARGLLGLAGGGARQMVLSIPAICIGSRTAAAAREEGFNVIGQAETQDADALAELTAELLSVPTQR